MKRTIGFFSIFILAALLLSSCNVLDQAPEPTAESIPTVQASSSVISQGNLVPKDTMYLAFPGVGHVSEILVKQGDLVSKGQVLARLGDRQQYEASLTAALMEVENAQQALDDLNANADIISSNAWLALLNANENVIHAETAWADIDNDDYQETVDDAEVAVSEAQTELDDAQTEFDKVANLDPDNALYKDAETALKDAQLAYDNAVHERDLLIIDREMAKANLELAKAQRAQAEIDYNLTLEGPDPDQLTLAQMNIDTAQTHLTAAQAALDNLDLKAPFDGTVADVNVSVDELVSNGQWAILVADYSAWYVETNDLTEQEVVKLSIGQAASISPDALPDVEMKGEVTEIADVYTVLAGDVLYKVRLLVEEPDPNLRWGMTVEITFDS